MYSTIREDAEKALAYVEEVLSTATDDATAWLLTQAIEHLEAIIDVIDDD